MYRISGHGSWWFPREKPRGSGLYGLPHCLRRSSNRTDATLRAHGQPPKPRRPPRTHRALCAGFLTTARAGTGRPEIGKFTSTLRVRRSRFATRRLRHAGSR
ncbi:Hypothetical Protein RRSL_04661 [Ralstonia solanacearum UW551]|uniref:Uncharacterized protein n=1 Tax=Ralstonia solanacearum (strain UW551) TaxID=342110 RepID=A0AB33VJP8_RALSU|nr:Hypothetical Protein RRSL_04661 [Ralstonia solanacearum UW551]